MADQRKENARNNLPPVLTMTRGSSVMDQRSVQRELWRIMASTSGGLGDGVEIGAVLCLGRRERPQLYSGKV